MLTVLFDGVAYGMVLFILACGLAVTLGLMNLVNLAHGAFAMMGGYAAVVLVNRWGVPFLLALPRYHINLPIFWKLVIPIVMVSAASMAEVSRDPRAEEGQASVELVAAVPALILAALISLQLLAAGYALTLADGAAEAGALALAEGGSAADAARAALPGWADDNVWRRMVPKGWFYNVEITGVKPS